MLRLDDADRRVLAEWGIRAGALAAAILIVAFTLGLAVRLFEIVSGMS